MRNDDLEYTPDLIGPWSETKHAILREYAAAYTRILHKQRGLKYVYVDAFAGAGEAVRKVTGERVPGSPLYALAVEPRFDEYHFVEYNPAKAAALAERVAGHPNAFVYEGDASTVLLEKIFPTLLYSSYRRALCLLDPYGLHLRWEVIERAGKLRTVDVLLNFPTMDMNRAVLKKVDSKIRDDAAERMTAFWGDESWRDVAYGPPNLLGERHKLEDANDRMADAFCDRLRERADFSEVLYALPMRNNEGAMLYYLIFASQQPRARLAMTPIFAKYRR